ncbi:hypothetical protein ACWGJT_34545 [Streptomyces xantholiticus]
MVRTSTSHPSASAWYNATTFMGTLAATDASGVTGYAVRLDQSPTTAAGTTVTQTTADVNWSARTDGTWWGHAAAKDKAGLWSPTQHNGFNVDTTAPGAPGGLVSSPARSGHRAAPTTRSPRCRSNSLTTSVRPPCRCGSP